MAFKPMFALHKDSGGSVLAASDFTHEYQLSGWLQKLNFRPGDVIEFREVMVRPDFDEVEEPLRKADEPLTPPSALADEEQPF